MQVDRRKIWQNRKVSNTLFFILHWYQIVLSTRRNITHSAKTRVWRATVALSTTKTMDRAIGMNSENLKRRRSCPGISIMCSGAYINGSSMVSWTVCHFVIQHPCYLAALEISSGWSIFRFHYLALDQDNVGLVLFHRGDSLHDPIIVDLHMQVGWLVSWGTRSPISLFFLRYVSPWIDLLPQYARTYKVVHDGLSCERQSCDEHCVFRIPFASQ